MSASDLLAYRPYPGYSAGSTYLPSRCQSGLGCYDLWLFLLFGDCIIIHLSVCLYLFIFWLLYHMF